MRAMDKSVGIIFFSALPLSYKIYNCCFFDCFCSWKNETSDWYFQGIIYLANSRSYFCLLSDQSHCFLCEAKTVHINLQQTLFAFISLTPSVDHQAGLGRICSGLFCCCHSFHFHAERVNFTVIRLELNYD